MVDLGDRVEAREAEHAELGNMLDQPLSVLDLDEHVPSEQALPGVLGDDSNRQLVVAVCADATVLHEDILALDVCEQTAVELFVVFLIERAVDRAPPDVIGRGGFVDYQLVVRRAPGVVPRANDHGAQVGDESLSPAHDPLVESGGVECPVDAAHVPEAMVLETVLGRPTLVLSVHAIFDLLISVPSSSQLSG